MYKKDRFRQMGLADFDQPMGMKMNPDNRWIKRAATIPWDKIEERYAELFPSGTENPAKPLRRARIEKQFFDACNESNVLIGAIERYGQREGHYPERVLVDKIYRNRKNLSFCKRNGIQVSGPPLGRSKKDPVIDRKQEHRDAVHRIEVERRFSLAKRCYGLGLIWTKLATTTRSSIALSIIAMNVDRLTAYSLYDFLEPVFQSVWTEICYLLSTKNTAKPICSMVTGS